MPVIHVAGAQRQSTEPGITGPPGIPGPPGTVGTLAGDVTGPPGTTVVAKIQGQTIDVSGLATGNVITYDGVQWENGAVNLSLAAAVTGALPPNKLAAGNNGDFLQVQGAAVVWAPPALLGPQFKGPVRLATAAALPANTRTGNVLTASANGALPTIDGGAPAVNDRILVQTEATGANNGWYSVTSLGSGGTPWVLTRTTDADVSAEVLAGTLTAVEEGTTHGDTVRVLTTNNPITLNTTALAFSSVGGVAGVPTLNQVLTSGPTTGALDIQVSSGQAVDYLGEMALERQGAPVLVTTSSSAANFGAYFVGFGATAPLGPEKLRVEVAAIGDTPTAAVAITNASPATDLARVQRSGSLQFRAHVWDLDAAADRTVDWAVQAGGGPGNDPIATLDFSTAIQGVSGGAPTRIARLYYEPAGGGSVGLLFEHEGLGATIQQAARTTAGDGGTLRLTAQTPSAGVGGKIEINAANGVGTNQGGGGVSVTLGSPTGSGTGGAYTLARPGRALDSLLYTGARTYDANASMTYTWQVNAVTEMVLSETTLNLQSNDLITTGDVSIGTTPALTGDGRVPHGFQLKGRNNANNADAFVMRWGSTTDNVEFGEATNVATVTFSALTSQSFLIGGADALVLSNKIETYLPEFKWRSTVVTPGLHQDDDATSGATGDTLTIHAQDVVGSGTTISGGTLTVRAGDAESGSATNRQGGSLILAGGTGGAGTGEAGVVQIQSGGTICARFRDIGTAAQVGLYGATPVAQHSSTGETTGFTAGGGTNVTDASTFTGNVGSTAYRISDVVRALKNIGAMAA